jgi:hypothetical protein
LLAAATALLCVVSASKAIDLTPFVAQLTPVSFRGQSLQYDSNYSESDQVFFDLNGQLAAPAFELNDEGATTALFVWSAGSPPGVEIWQGSDPSACAQALTAVGFTVGTANLSGSQGGSETAMSQSDEANLQGVYQVALWIFGAVLMLPIILKVRPH